jgi:hypothetical protein
MRRLAFACAGALIAFAGCHDQETASPLPADGGPGDDASSDACPACVSDQDCGGTVCAQLGNDSKCVPACPNGNECASDRACVSATNVAGAQVSVCVPRGDECGLSADDLDSGPPPQQCPGLAGPTTAASCTSCTGKPNCQPNGCYGGWWCNTATNRCQSPPSGCGSSGPFDGGAPVTGNVGATGGTLNRLYFAVIGDTRPPSPDDTGSYPTPIITKIFQDVQALSPRPAFVVSTGDYMFASVGSPEADKQLDLYLGARAGYAGTTFPAMGNHECTGATASNCGAGSTNGITTNYTSFMQKMLGPIAMSAPYYSVRVDAPDGSWTSKFVVIAANAWDATQSAWLDGELAKPTTYTFVVRHEGAQANTAPGVTPSEQIMAAHPYTMSIVGHAHTYFHFSGSREVVVGNGGAPLSTGKNYGFAVVQQRPDNAIQVDMLDWSTLGADTLFRFAVKADGTGTP